MLLLVPGMLLLVPGLLLLVSCMLLLVSCGPTDPEVMLREASERVAERRLIVEQARERLDKREEALDAAEAERDRAIQALRDAERRLEAAETEVAEHASDELLFRVVQRHLLEDRSLEGVAIAAEVAGRVVVLSGDVADPKLRDRAVAVAREIPGVRGVESRIRVATPAKPAPADPAG
jgi:osmotically-inducible protein OsmY